MAIYITPKLKKYYTTINIKNNHIYIYEIQKRK